MLIGRAPAVMTLATGVLAQIILVQPRVTMTVIQLETTENQIRFDLLTMR